MNLVGELVLVRNQILQFTQSTDESGLVAASQRLNLTTRELQEGVMKTRMQSIGTVWARFPRTVRDIAHACGKQVRIGMEGENTELDRTIIEAIKDPLTHLIRNAVDHGIEDPATRVAAGKNAEGVLSLRAFHEGAYVSIEIKDDGAGLDLSRVRAKAARNNLVPADQLARMSDRDITNLIFLPGFSTAETVTKVSGRGVGMDVVKTNIEKVGGTVDILTARGEGTTVRMKIPLTLTIIPALIVSSDNSRYAIPQMSLLELVRLEGEQIRRQIETVHGSPVYRLRGHLLPLVYLKQVLRGASSSTDSNLPDSGYGTEELDFSRARSDHEQYLLTLQGRYAKNEAGGPTGADLARSCPLGDWIQRVGINKFSTMPEMYELGRADKAFHDVVDSFLALGTSVDVAQAKGKLEELAKANHRITRLLTAIESLVIEKSIVNIVVLQARDQQFGLIVDAVNDTAEIVVKPLGNQLKRLNVYSGATITGDGKVVLILDSVGLAQRAHIFETNRTESVERAVAAHALVETVGGRNSVVLVECGANQRLAIALSSVARLEEFAKDSLETTGEVQSVQYRGQIMRLLRISDVIHPTNRKKLLPLQGSLKVVVFSVKGQHVGLVVDRILDIADEAFVVQEQGRRNGILGCAVIQQRITDILDVPALIAALDKTSRGKAAHA
jgi:chemotaxis protein histidine kinase CheA